MPSYQHHYSGVTGYNDCTLLTADSSFIDNRPDSRSPTPAPPTPQNPEMSRETSPDEVMELLEQVFGRKSTLPERELNHYKSRLTVALPKVDASHLGVVYSCLNKALSGESADAKKTLVDYSLVTNGVSAWILPLRRVVESLD
ncbi:hypothetical protein TRVA0_006S03906 [Trichomonascus vanleenenianus]|uniref:uncharacterized protein n=1 Tax=Trichomonascus vanleenenianus TaxID=2268995 RepID=UPI003ECB969F